MSARSRTVSVVATTIYPSLVSPVLSSCVWCPTPSSGSTPSPTPMGCLPLCPPGTLSPGATSITANMFVWNSVVMPKRTRSIPTTCALAPLVRSVLDHPGTNKGVTISCASVLGGGSIGSPGPPSPCLRMPSPGSLPWVLNRECRKLSRLLTGSVMNFPRRPMPSTTTTTVHTPLGRQLVLLGCRRPLRFLSFLFFLLQSLRW